MARNQASLVLVGIVTASVILSVLVGKLRGYSFIAGLMAILLTALIPFGGWIIVSWYLPNRATRRQEVVPGAALVGVGALALHIVTVYWIAREVEIKTDTYGAWLSGPGSVATKIRVGTLGVVRGHDTAEEPSGLGVFVARYKNPLRLVVIGFALVILVVINAPTPAEVLVLAIIVIALLLLIEFLGHAVRTADTAA